MSRPKNPRPSNPFPNLFLASDTDKLKEFNNQLSEILIKEMDEAYKILAAGEVEEYIAGVNDIIARNFDIDEKITAIDLLQEVSLVESLQEGLKCKADQITFTGSFATNRDAVPVLNVIFPEFDYTKKCLPEITEYPVDTPLTVPEKKSYVSSFNQLLANALFGKVGKEDLHCAISNPPEVNISWLSSSEFQSQKGFTITKDYRCAIPPFFQNYILSADQLSEAGGKKHFIFNSPAANASEPLFFHYIGAALDDSETVAYVSGKKMFFVKNGAFNPSVLLHETMHWLGVHHAQKNPNLQRFLRSWGIKVGDPYPSISGYSSIILGNDKNFKNYIDDTDVTRGDNRQSYLRPFDVLLLEALRHKRMVCLPEREAAGYVVDDANITRSTGQECAAKYISELEKHSFETLPSSSQRILAQSFQRIVGVEIPITLAEIALQSLCESSNPDNEIAQRMRNYVISKNGIETLRTVIRSGINLLTMGVRPMAAAVVLESGVHATATIGKKVCKTISEKTGFSDSAIAKRLEENANYISTYVPEDMCVNFYLAWPWFTP